MMTNKRSAEKTVRDIRQATRRHYSAEEKTRIVLEGLRGEDSIARRKLLSLVTAPKQRLLFTDNCDLQRIRSCCRWHQFNALLDGFAANE